MYPNIYGDELPREFRSATVDEVLRLSRVARDHRLSASGRPVWLRAKMSEVKTVVIRALLPKSGYEIPVYRCLVGVVCVDGVSVFTLDVPQGEFAELAILDDVYELVDLILGCSRHVPVYDADGDLL